MRSNSVAGAPPPIVWFRLDLRLADNPALSAAVATGGPIIPVFVWAPEEESPWEPRGATRWWLHRSLEALDKSLGTRGSRLLIRCGPTLPALLRLAEETGAGAIFWNRRYEPATIKRDKQIKESLRTAGLEVASSNSALLHEPWEVENKTGKPYQVFTPYWKACLANPDPTEPLPAPKKLAAPTKWPDGAPLASLRLQPTIPWDGGLKKAWIPGETAGLAMIDRTCSSIFESYSEERNRPDHAGTSKLSPYLHFGEIGPRQIWHALRRTGEREGWPVSKWRQSQFLAEVGWREFAHHLLYHFPYTPEQPLRNEWEKFSWPGINPTHLHAWQHGQTGYPIVDAGMRELWATGWMHNRVRMIVASFLTKDLVIPWQEGARWFWDTLVDADLASNTLGWQWTAGCGADAAPYFRVFNPVSQGQKFDPEGNYVRQWIPELAKLPGDTIHAPWEVHPALLAAAKVTLGKTYPAPIVDHGLARQKALNLFDAFREGTRPK